MEKIEMDTIEISVADILQSLLRKWWIILISIFICAAIMFAYSSTGVLPMYGLSMSFYVSPEFGNAQATTAVTAGQTAALAEASIKTYMELLNEPAFYVELEEKLEGQCSTDYSAGRLSSMISYSNSEGVNIIQAKVVGENQNDVFTISKALENAAPLRVESIVGNKALTPTNIMDASALEWVSRVNDNATRNTVLGALLGAIISAAVIILVKVFDVRINDENDLKRTYDVPVLGVIPNFEEVIKDNQKKTVMYGGKTGENSKK